MSILSEEDIKIIELAKKGCFLSAHSLFRLSSIIEDQQKEIEELKKEYKITDKEEFKKLCENYLGDE